VNDADCNGTCCGGIKVRTDISKLSNMGIATAEIWWVKVRFHQVTSKTKPRLRAERVVLSEDLCILSSCFVRPMSMNSVLQEQDRRSAVIQEEIC